MDWQSYSAGIWHLPGTCVLTLAFLLAGAKPTAAAVLHIDTQSREITLKELLPGQSQLKPCHLQQTPVLGSLVCLECR